MGDMSSHAVKLNVWGDHELPSVPEFSSNPTTIQRFEIPRVPSAKDNAVIDGPHSLEPVTEKAGVFVEGKKGT